MNVFVCTAAYNPGDNFPKWCGQLARQTDMDFTALVVDDGSTPALRQCVEMKFDLRILREEHGNLWWGGGMKRVFQWACTLGRTEDVIIITNVDTHIPPNLVSSIRKTIGSQSTVSCALTVPSVDRSGIATAGFRLETKNLSFAEVPIGEEINCCSTRCFAFRIGDYLRIGEVDHLSFPHYLSDVDLTYRFHKAGIPIQAMSEIRITYDREESTKSNLRPGHPIANFSRLCSTRCKHNPKYFLRLNAKYNFGVRKTRNSLIIIAKALMKVLWGASE